MIYRNTDTITPLCYFPKKVRTFFFFVEKILISKLHYINEQKLIKTLSYKFRSLIFFIQLRSRLETFIEYRNYYSLRRSQFTNKPWWVDINKTMRWNTSLSLSLSLYIYIYIYFFFSPGNILRTYFERQVATPGWRAPRNHALYSYFHIGSLFFQFFFF